MFTLLSTEAQKFGNSSYLSSTLHFVTLHKPSEDLTSDDKMIKNYQNWKCIQQEYLQRRRVFLKCSNYSRVPATVTAYRYQLGSTFPISVILIFAEFIQALTAPSRKSVILDDQELRICRWGILSCPQKYGVHSASDLCTHKKRNFTFRCWLQKCECHGSLLSLYSSIHGKMTSTPQQMLNCSQYFMRLAASHNQKLKNLIASRKLLARSMDLPAPRCVLRTWDRSSHVSVSQEHHTVLHSMKLAVISTQRTAIFLLEPREYSKHAHTTPLPHSQCNRFCFKTEELSVRYKTSFVVPPSLRRLTWGFELHNRHYTSVHRKKQTQSCSLSG